jgi:hypothetical protein
MPIRMLPSRIFSYFTGLLIVGLFLTESSAKSLRDIHIGGTHLGYRFHGGVDVEVAGTQYDASYHGLLMGYSYRFRNNGSNTGRLTWDSSLNLSVLSEDSGPIRGARMGLRTGIGYEYLVTQQMLLKLDLGLDVARFSTESRLTGLVAEEESWEFGGHIDASLLYVVHPGMTLFGSLGMESMSDQAFRTIKVDSGDSITFSTGIFFPW